MKRSNWLTLCAVVALPLSFGVAHAAKPVDPETLPKVECSALKFGAAFLAKYPKAPAACLEGREYKGKRYAKFEAKVYISDPEFMTVQLLNAAGDMVTAFSFKPAPNQHVKVEGKDKDFHHVAVGDKLTFWVPEDRMTAEALPGSTKDSWAVLPPR